MPLFFKLFRKENWGTGELHILSNGILEKSAIKNGAFCVWLIGLSASGKTTLAQLLAHSLAQRGFRVKVLDGDIVRNTLSKGLGFTPADRIINLRRIAFIARNLVSQRIVTIVAAICPYRPIREEVRGIIGEFVEVYLNCPLEVCIRRDPKGLYRKALAGEIQHFTGIDDAFEPPLRPDIEVATHAFPPEESLDQILRGLETLRRISSDTLAAPEEEAEKAVQIQRSRGIAR
jgi:adenylylsulfate kinase